MNHIHFINCMKVVITQSENVSLSLNLHLYQCPLWTYILYDELIYWSNGPLCLSTPLIKTDHCHNRDSEYILGRFWSEEVECQCDDYCSVFNDCCDDFGSNREVIHDWNNSHIALLMSSKVNEMIECASNQIPPWNRTHSLGYFMVTDCPDKKHRLRKRCKLLNTERDMDIYHFIPVEIKGIVYRNVFCAWCHGVKKVTEKNFWAAYAHSNECIYDRFRKKGVPVPFPRLFHDCFSPKNGIVGPKHGPHEILKISDIDRGSSRLGKMCIISGPASLVTKNTPLIARPEESPLAKSYRECKNAIQEGVDSPAKGFHFILAKTAHGFDVVRNVASICQNCQDLMRNLLTNDGVGLNGLQSAMIPPAPNSMAMGMLIFFNDHAVVEESMFIVIDQKPDKKVHKMSIDYISRVGSFFSLTSILSIMFMLKQRGNFCYSEPRRLQFSLICSKMMFFIFLYLSAVFAEVKLACRIVAILLHTALLTSFLSTILFGLNVLKMMIDMKFNMAAVAANSKDYRKIGLKEALQFVGVSFIVMGFGISAAVVEFTNTDDDDDDPSFFGYGQDEVCFVTKSAAQLWFVVVPTAATVFINIISTLFSLLLIWNITKNNELNFGSAESLLGYLCRLLAYQSIQWVFGLIYYLNTDLIVVGYIFSVFSSFEGMFIFIAVYKSKG